MKKILFVTQDNFDAVRSRAPLSNWIFRNKNVQCDILCPMGSKVKLENSNVFYFKKRGINFNNYNTYKKLVKKENYDLIIVRAIEKIILTTLIRTGKSKIVFFLPGFGKLFIPDRPFYNLIRTLYKPFLKLLISYKSAGLILQNSEDINYLNVNNVHLMNGSGLDNIAVKKDKKIDKIRIVTATRLTKSKGLYEIFEFCELIKTKTDVEYYILGDFTHLNINQISKIKSLNTHPNIFFEGFQFPITNYLNFCHFAYYPTKYPEGSPRFLIESLMHGLVIFTNPMQGCKALISNNNGYIIKTPAKSLQKMIEISTNKNNLNKLSNNSKKLFFSDYESNVIYEKLFKYLKLFN